MSEIANLGCVVDGAEGAGGADRGDRTVGTDVAKIAYISEYLRGTA